MFIKSYTFNEHKFFINKSEICFIRQVAFTENIFRNIARNPVIRFKIIENSDDKRNSTSYFIGNEPKKTSIQKFQQSVLETSSRRFDKTSSTFVSNTFIYIKIIENDEEQGNSNVW